MARRFSTATPLALAYGALIVYASLYPFTGWRPAVASTPLDWLWLPWPNWWLRFDVVANFVGYLPLGFLCVIAWLRSGGSLAVALPMTMLAGVLLSLSLETLQNFLPQRVPSRADWALNSGGACLGALLAGALSRLGLVERWHSARERWFLPRSAAALALLTFWPVGLLFPPAVPFASGGSFPALVESLGRWLEDTALTGSAQTLLAAADMSGIAPPTASRVGFTIALGFLSPCLVALSVARPGWRRLALPVGALGLGLAVTMLSTALSFGPSHALAWRTDIVPASLGLAFGAALVACLLPARAAAAVGLVVISLQLALVSMTPVDPYYAQSLQQWEQGRFIRFHGLAQWVGWAWPYVALLYLLRRVTRRPEGSQSPSPS